MKRKIRKDLIVTSDSPKPKFLQVVAPTVTETQTVHTLTAVGLDIWTSELQWVSFFLGKKPPQLTASVDTQALSFLVHITLPSTLASHQRSFISSKCPQIGRASCRERVSPYV